MRSSNVSRNPFSAQFSVKTMLVSKNNFSDAAKCNYIANVGKAVKRSYIFGVHYALQNQVPVKKSCVDLALGYVIDCEEFSYAKKVSIFKVLPRQKFEVHV